jgi:CxxC motif-containing protein
MSAREITCIACPMGCRLQVSPQENGGITVKNYGCKRGIAYGEQEFTRPMRMVTSSVRVKGGAMPLCAVKTAQPVPKAQIGAVLAAIGEAVAPAPLQRGQVVLADIAGTGVDLVATASVSAS